MDSILPADYFKAFSPDDPAANDLTCMFCFKGKEDEEAIYCSRRCAVSHTLLKLTGGNTTQEDWDYMESYVSFLFDPGCINVHPSEEIHQPAPEVQKSVVVTTQTQRMASSASARLFERLADLGKLDDELTINGLIETLEDGDNIDDSGESSPRSLSHELVDVLLDDDTQFAQSSIEEINKLASAVKVEDDAETDHIVQNGTVPISSAWSVSEQITSCQCRNVQ